MQKWISGLALATVSAFGVAAPAEARDAPKVDDACADISPQTTSLQEVVGRIDVCAERLAMIEPERTKRRAYYSVAASGSGLVALVGGSALTPAATTALTTIGLVPIFADNRFNNAGQAQVYSAVANQLNFVTHHANEAEGRAKLFTARAEALDTANRALLQSVTSMRSYVATIPALPASSAADAQKAHVERIAGLQTAISIAENASARADETRALLLARVERHNTLSVPTAVRLYDEARSQRTAALARIEPTPAQSLTTIVSAPLSALTSVFRTGADVPPNLLLPASASGVAVAVQANDLDIPSVSVDVPSTTFNRNGLRSEDMDKVDALAAAARNVALELRVTQELQK